jgi:hypothetical protein
MRRRNNLHEGGFGAGQCSSPDKLSGIPFADAAGPNQEPSGCPARPTASLRWPLIGGPIKPGMMYSI